MDHNDLYDHLRIEKDLVTDFSILFSRFEYALKRTDDYALGNKNEVHPNWNKFALDHDKHFNTERTTDLKVAVEYLESHPPMKQVLKNGSLDWKITPKERTPLLQRIILSVRRVRNNLFHGGKFSNGPVDEPGRDKKLLQFCTIVLEECLSLNEKIQEQFYKNEL